MKLFLSLEDAVNVAQKHFDIDPIIARNEFEQKCYIPDGLGLSIKDHQTATTEKEILEIWLRD